MIPPGPMGYQGSIGHQGSLGDPDLQLLFEIQEACPEAAVASGLHLGARILLKNYVEAMKALDQAHSVDRCPYNRAHNPCLPCVVLEKARIRK